jgi:Mn-dependent DtxR family transcriptional regulator
MTTEEAKRSVSYGSIVSNLLALRDEVRDTSHEEAEAIERIVSDVMALQLHDGYVSQKSMAYARN